MAGGGQMGGGQPPSGAYGSPNFDSSNPINQPLSGSGMSPFRQAGATSEQPSMDTQPIPFNDPYFQPRFDYMYGNQFNSMNQFNPFTRGYYGADPMYGGYSPFYPALPTPNMQSMPSRLGEIEEQLEEQKRKLDEEEASRKSINFNPRFG